MTVGHQRPNLVELKWRRRVSFQEKTQTLFSLGFNFRFVSKVFRVMECKLFQPPVSPLCLHHSTVMMTLRRDSAASVFLCSRPLKQIYDSTCITLSSFIALAARLDALWSNTPFFYLFIFLLTYERNFTCLAPFSSEPLCSDSCLNTIMLL